MYTALPQVVIGKIVKAITTIKELRYTMHYQTVLSALYRISNLILQHLQQLYVVSIFIFICIL